MTHAKGTTDPPIRVLRADASHSLALTGPIVVALWENETSSAGVHELAGLLAAHAAENGRVALLQVIGERATPPEANVRAELAAMLKDNEARIVA